MLNELKRRSGDYIQLENNKDRVLPSAEDMLRQATLRLGGPSGEVVTVEDIRHYLGARLFRHLESGDRASKDHQLLQQAQDFSSPTGVQAAIEIFKAQSESLKGEFSTPKGERDRDLIREGLALGLSRIKLEIELLPKLQIPTVEQEPILEDGSVSHQTAPERFQGTEKEKKEKTIRAALSIWYQPDDHKITSEELRILLDNPINPIMMPAGGGDPILFQLAAVVFFDSVKKAKDFAKSKEGRDAAVQVVEIQAEGIIDILKKGKPTDVNERILKVRHVVAGVKDLMAELEKGSKRS